MLESTRGQPPATLDSIAAPGLKSPCFTVRQTVSSTGSISNVRRELSAALSGSTQVNTKRFGGVLSNTSPFTMTSRLSPSPLACSHFEPFFQEEIFSQPPQYWRANSGLVMAAQRFSGVV